MAQFVVLGAAIYACTTRQDMATAGARQVTEHGVNASIMADLQQKHSIELSSIIKAMQGRVGGNYATCTDMYMYMYMYIAY